MQLSRTVWLQEGLPGQIKSLPSQKKSVCVCNQGDTRLQPERMNSQVCDLHLPKQRRGPRNPCLPPRAPGQEEHGHL